MWLCGFGIAKHYWGGHSSSVNFSVSLSRWDSHSLPTSPAKKSGLPKEKTRSQPGPHLPSTPAQKRFVSPPWPAPSESRPAHRRWVLAPAAPAPRGELRGGCCRSTDDGYSTGAGGVWRCRAFLQGVLVQMELGPVKGPACAVRQPQPCWLLPGRVSESGPFFASPVNLLPF